MKPIELTEIKFNYAGEERQIILDLNRFIKVEEKVGFSRIFYLKFDTYESLITVKQTLEEIKEKIKNV